MDAGTVGAGDPIALAYTVASIIVGIIVVSGFSTAVAIRIFNRATETLSTQLKTSIEQIRTEFKELRDGVDEKLDSFYLHVDQKIESVKTNVRDLSTDQDKTKDSLHQLEREFLLHNAQQSDKFITRREFDDLKERLK